MQPVSVDIGGSEVQNWAGTRGSGRFSLSTSSTLWLGNTSLKSVIPLAASYMWNCIYHPPNQQTNPQTNKQNPQTNQTIDQQTPVFPSTGGRSSSEEWVHICTVSHWNEKLGVLVSTPALRVFLAELQLLIWATWTPGYYEHFAYGLSCWVLLFFHLFSLQQLTFILICLIFQQLMKKETVHNQKL